MGRAAGAGSPLHTTSLPIPTFLCVPVSQLPARPQVRASDVVLPEGPVVLLCCRLATGVLAQMLGESKVRGRSGGLCSPNFGSHYCMSCC